MDTNLQETPEVDINVPMAGRMLSAMAGAFLISRAIRKHKLDAVVVAAGGYLLYRAVTGHCLIKGVLTHPDSRNVNLTTSLAVNKPRHEVYELWKDVERLPTFMKHLGSVSKLDAQKSSWKIDAPAGVPSIQWTAEIVKDEKDKEISWHSLPDSTIENSGKVNFSDTPAGGTRIDVHLSYRPPFGKAGEELGWLLNGVFKAKIAEDIRGFKRYAENN